MKRPPTPLIKLGAALASLLYLSAFAPSAWALSAPSEPVEHTPRATLDLHLKQTARLEKSAAPGYAIELPPAPQSALTQAPPTPGKALKIGIAREVPPNAQSLEIDDRLRWEPSTDGGRFARIEIGVEGAAGIRFELRVIALPAQAELRFYSLRDGQPSKARQAITGRAIHRILNQNYRAHPERPPALGYWSPTLPGERVGVEIYLPAGVPPERVRLAIPRIAQLTALPTEKNTSDIGQAGFCEIDLACNDKGDWNDTATSVAKMVYLKNGVPFLCSGTLINDLDNTTQRPLFLGAEHCIDTQETASTLDTFWFFQRQTCFSSNLDDWVQLSGGARLLSHGSASDYALLELNDQPPNGARFAGWTTTTPARFSTVTAIHHPEGDLKKISFGQIARQVENASNPALDSPFEVAWSSGVTEPGSSGSPLFNRSQQLIGTLWGGRSSCSNPFGADVFGRFAVTEKAIADELAGGGGSGTSEPRIGTLASRAWVGTGDQVMIAGVQIRGSGEARMVARGVGPSLGQAGLIDLLPDPEIQLFSGQTLLAENDDWGSTADAQTIVDAGLRPGNPLEAALLRTLAPGPYTVILRDHGGRTGIGGLAVDDLELPEGVRLEAISTRAFISGGDKVLIAGFRIIGGEKTVVLRAFGPSLDEEPNSGLSADQVLQDPRLEVFSGSTLIGENDDWRSSSGADLIQTNGLAPRNGLESAVLMTLPEGAYTVVVKGVGSRTGIAGVAVNELP